MMSHVAKCELEVKDIDALKRACEKLGLEFCEAQKTWAWYGRWVNDYHAADAAYHHGIKPEQYGKCEHAIRVPDCEYEISLVRDDRGRLVPIYDFYGPGQRIRKLLGSGCERLRQQYGAEVTKKTMRRRGWRVSEQYDPQTHQIKLRCVR